MPDHPFPTWRILREPAVIELTGYSRSSIRRKVKAGEFPAPIKLGTGPSGAVGWKQSEVVAWIEARAAGVQWG